jgi:hypothetical protein
MRNLRHPSTALRTGSEAVPLSKTEYFNKLLKAYPAIYSTTSVKFTIRTNPALLAETTTV